MYVNVKDWPSLVGGMRSEESRTETDGDVLLRPSVLLGYHRTATHTHAKNMKSNAYAA